MSDFVCKCGRFIRKSSSADTTGNRDVEGCAGCPYLMPYGPYKYIDGAGYKQDIQGYECRASRRISYTTTYIGGAQDNTTLRICSLDMDFLERVARWIREQYPGGQLNGVFSREHIRPTDYSSAGRLCMPVACAQNKAGRAAKARLLDEFFTADKRRKDLIDRCQEGRKMEDIEREMIVGRIREATAKGDKACANCQPTSPTPTPTAAPSASPSREIAPGAATGPIAPGGQDEPACLCASCTCSGCHESCHNGHCTGCGDPTTSCNSYQHDEHKAASLSTAPQTAPAAAAAFDYSSLDQRTADALHAAERIILEARKAFWVEAAKAVAIAHEALCGVATICRNSKHGTEDATHCRNLRGNNQHSDKTFGAWCASLGITRKTAERLLQIHALLSASTAEERATLEAAGPSLLYAAAKPSAPPELVAAVKSGDITTHKEYQELLARYKQEKALRKQAEAEASQAANEAAEYSHEADRQMAAVVKAQAAQAEAEDAARAAKKERQALEKLLAEADKQLEASRALTDSLRRANDRLGGENADLKEALKAQPIPATILDDEQVEAMARQRAQNLTAEAEAGREKIYRAYQWKLCGIVEQATAMINAAVNLVGPCVGRMDNEQYDKAMPKFISAVGILDSIVEEAISMRKDGARYEL